jgi:hypothetical protein
MTNPVFKDLNIHCAYWDNIYAPKTPTPLLLIESTRAGLDAHITDVGGESKLADHLLAREF